MKITFYIIMLVVVLLCLANTTIQYKPFKITFDTPFLAIGIFCIMLGIFFIMIQTYTSTYERGLSRGCEIEHEAALEAARQIIKEDRMKGQAAEENKDIKEVK